MAAAASIKAAADVLCKQIKDKLGVKDSNRAVTAATRRQLFNELAALRNRAEAAATTDVLDTLDGKRSSLCLAKKAQTLGDKVSMYGRLALVVFIAAWGAVCLLTLTPLRLLHPILRRMGVPNGRLPLDVAVDQWSRGVLAAAGVKVTVERGSVDWISQTDLVGIIVYNHASNLDPFIVNAVCTCGPKYIGKKVLFTLPILGWVFIACGMVPLNRGNREKAVNTMNEVVANVMKKWRRSVAISPEGTRTTDGHLRLPFKKGVFHLQEQTKVPLLPVVIHGAYELWPPGRVFASPGEVFVSYLPPQYPVEASEAWNSRDATRMKLQQGYCEYIAKSPDRGAGKLSAIDILVCCGRLIITLSVYSVIWSLLPSLGATRWASLFLAVSAAMALYVEKFL